LGYDVPFLQRGQPTLISLNVCMLKGPHPCTFSRSLCFYRFPQFSQLVPLWFLKVNLGIPMVLAMSNMHLLHSYLLITSNFAQG
jgi:hypothetical protein